MDAISCIMSKRETRGFLDKPVEEESIGSILEAGRLAGSAKNRQPWGFILVKERERLEGLAKYGNSTGPLASGAFGVVIVIPDDYMQDRFDAGRAAQNMMLAAHAMGIGSCPVTLHNPEGAKEYLGVLENLQIQVALAFGHPVPKRRVGKVRRRSMGEILHEERW